MSIEEYSTKLYEVLKKVEKTQSDSIKQVADLFVKTIENDKIIHVFGTGHSHIIGIEMFVRAGGLANVNAMLDESILTSPGARRGGDMERLNGLAEIIWNQYRIEKDDIMIIISNSGRNSVPVEMAMKAKKNGLKLIAITSYENYKNTSSRHESGKKICDLADIVIDNCVPEGDALMSFNGVKSGPVSTMTGSFIVDSILVETLSKLTEKGKQLPIFGSQNIDGFNNDDLYTKYEGRIKHM